MIFLAIPTFPGQSFAGVSPARAGGEQAGVSLAVIFSGTGFRLVKADAGAAKHARSGPQFFRLTS